MQVPAYVEYERATSVTHAIALLARFGPEARILAGGQCLMPMMKLRVAQPETLIDINGLSELCYIRVTGGAGQSGADGTGGELQIGALTRHAQLLDSAVAGEPFAILHDAEKVIAHPLVRNWGTVRGALSPADPSQGPAPALPPLQARPGLPGRAGPLGRGGDRRAGAGMGPTAVGARNFAAAEAEDMLQGAPPTGATLARAGEIAAEHCRPSSDQRGPADYKRHLARELTTRALRRALDRAEGPRRRPD